MEFFKPGINFNFMGNRWFFIPLSLSLLAISFIAVFIRGGLNPGIDFAGGTLVEIRFSKDVKVAEVRDAATWECKGYIGKNNIEQGR